MAVNMDTLLRLRVAVDGENNIRRLSGDLKGLERAAGSVSSGFNAMRAASAALASSAVVAGLTGIIKNAIDAGDELNNLQMKTGIAADALLGLRAAAKLGDVDTAMLAKGLNRLNVVIAEAAAGNQQSADKFKGLGVSIRDASGQVASTDVVFKRLADRFRDMPDGAGKAAAAAALFGTKMGAEFIPVLNEGSMAMDNLNVKIGDDFPARSDQFNDTLTVMGLRAEAMGLQLTDELLPALQSILNEFNKLFDSEDDFSALFESIKFAIRGAATVLLGFALAIQQTVRSVQILGEVLGKLSVGDFGGALKTGLSIGDQIGQNINAIQGLWTDAPAPPSSRRRGGREADTATMRGIDDQPPGGRRGGGRAAGVRAGSSAFQLSSQGQALVKAANSLGVSPLDLATIIGFETAGTYNPSKWGGAGGNYMGLIQFGGPERRQYGAYPGQSFEEQVQGPVVRYFKDRFAGVGMSTQGADLLTLYRTVLGGNPKANINGQDAFGTSPASGVAMMGGHRAEALRRFFGGSMENVGYGAVEAGANAAAAFDEMQKIKQQMREQLDIAVDLVDKSQVRLSLANATNEEERLTIEFNQERSERMARFIELQSKSLTYLEQENLGHAQLMEATAAQIEYEQKLADLKEQQLAATREMGDALGGQVFGTPDIVAPGDQQFSPFAGYVEGIGSMNEALNGLATTGFKGIEDAMVSLATTGKANFREFAAALLEDTARLIIQQLVLKTILSAIGGGGASFNQIPGFNPGTGDLLSPSGFNPNVFTMPALSPGLALPSAKGNVFARNGIVPFANGGIVNRPTLFPFARGGTFGTGVMGEAGPEAIIPLKRGRDGRLGVAGVGGGDISISVQVDAGGTKAEGNADTGRQLANVVANAVKTEMIRQKRPGGILSK